MNVLPVEFAEPVTDRLQLTWFEDCRPQLDIAALVKGLLATAAMSVLYGESGCGKTYFALHIALHIAYGAPCFGLRTTRGGVIYVAAEGGRAVLNRVAAFSIHHDGMENEGRVPFAAITAQVNLLDPGADTEPLIDKIGQAAREIDMPVALVVIDTLSRAMAGGEENSSEDMGLFVRNADRIRAETGAHVLIVHHSGKDQTRGARGHSLLRAATDTEIEITADESGTRRASVKKQRDLSTEGDYAFRLVSVELGRDTDGDPVIACAVEPIDCPGPARSRKESRRLPAGATRALQLLRNLIAEHGTPAPALNHIPQHASVTTEELWRKACYAGQIAESDNPEAVRKAYGRAARALIDAGQVGKWTDYVWLQ